MASAGDVDEARAQVWGSHRIDLAVLASMLGWLALTTRWLTWKQSVAVGGDIASYEPMAAAAPGLPHHTLGSAYTDRFLPHYAVGLVSHVLHLDLHLVYWVFSLAVLLGVVLVTRSLLGRLGVASITAWIAMAVVVLNPYLLRTYLPTPGMYADLLFVLGLAFAVLGLVDRRISMLLVGVVIAVVGRQTALLAIPPLAIWVLTDRRWILGKGVRAALAVALVVLPYVGHRIIRELTASFTTPFEPRVPQDTVLPLLLHPSGHVGALVVHVVRTALPLFIALALLAAAWWLGRRAGVQWSRDTRWRLAVLLIVSVAIVAQPLLISPDFPGLAANEQRLSALGVPTLALVVALVTAPLLRAWRPGSWAGPAILVVVFLVASLRHETALVGPPSKALFLLVQLVSAVLAAVALVLTVRGVRRTVSQPQDA